MKFFLISTTLCSFILFIANCESEATKSKEIKLVTNKDTVSYYIGTDIARSLKNIKDEIDLDVLMQGLTDQLSEKPLLVSEDQAQAIMREFSTKIEKKQKEKSQSAGKLNLDTGEKFLEENKTKEGVVTTESGLQYMVITKGTGATPLKTDKVKVHYKGTTTDGKEFDSSYKRGQPTTFPITGVIRGWTEALLLMSVGSKYKLFIPSELAYGERGAGQDIGPNSTLIFEVELLDIVK